mmetsp:Transcript_10546/g.28678  ORF Transcript_10546/g.28678 Transcript_10546/m.28678 type:complete len:92 (-) Transcript_10546:808-1083(-)
MLSQLAARAGGLRRAAVSVRRFSTAAAEESTAPFLGLDTAAWSVVGACYFGAILWSHRDSLEADGPMVTVPKAKLNKIQNELTEIKALLGK